MLERGKARNFLGRFEPKQEKRGNLMKNQVKWIFLGLGCLLALTGCTQAPLIEVEKGSAALLRVT